MLTSGLRTCLDFNDRNLSILDWQQAGITHGRSSTVALTARKKCWANTGLITIYEPVTCIERAGLAQAWRVIPLRLGTYRISGFAVASMP